jgi:dienelactone hydrolase
VKERVVTFGPEGILVGVLTEPDVVVRDVPVVVMSNVGLNHHVGISRTWVDLSRRLAARGVPSLRFDASGLGDSAPRDTLGSDVERSILDLEDALTWLASDGAQRFVLVSWCSGTDNAHAVAARDSRVAGAVFLDGYTYATPASVVHEKLLRWVDLARWRRALRRRFPQLFGLELNRQAAGWVDEIFNREYPDRHRFEADISTMIDRGARLLFIYSRQTDYFYPRQFWDWMKRKDWRGRIAVEYYPKADHAFRFRTERDVMMNRVTSWIFALGGR